MGFALPDDQDFPAKFLQLFLGTLISFHVLFELIGPEFNSRFLCVRVFADLMPMPVTTMNENHRLVFRQDDVWFTWQILSM